MASLMVDSVDACDLKKKRLFISNAELLPLKKLFTFVCNQ